MALRLTTFRVWTNKNTTNEWTASLDLCDTMLLVGKNATGKSKSVHSISNMARLISGRKSITNGSFVAEFVDEAQRVFVYSVEIDDGIIISEKLSVQGERDYLTRSADGTGKIYYDKQREELEFTIQRNQLAATFRRDKSQHSFLELLHEWASRVWIFGFGKPQRDNFLPPIGGNNPPDPSDYQRTIDLFLYASQQYSPPNFDPGFSQSVADTMHKLGYGIVKVETQPLKSIVLEGFGMSFHPPCFVVYETDLFGPTDQREMSDGMYRALLLVIHFMYSGYADAPACIIVDDIGEGLDYDRTVQLLNWMLTSASDKKIQLIMTTNDRFIMNAVPLDCWYGIRRTSHGPKFITRRTDPQLFSKFEETGLSNFDFLRSNFLEFQPSEE